MEDNSGQRSGPGSAFLAIAFGILIAVVVVIGTRHRVVDGDEPIGPLEEPAQIDGGRIPSADQIEDLFANKMEELQKSQIAKFSDYLENQLPTLPAKQLVEEGIQVRAMELAQAEAVAEEVAQRRAGFEEEILTIRREIAALDAKLSGELPDAERKGLLYEKDALIEEVGKLERLRPSIEGVAKTAELNIAAATTAIQQLERRDPEDFKASVLHLSKKALEELKSAAPKEPAVQGESMKKDVEEEDDPFSDQSTST